MLMRLVVISLLLISTATSYVGQSEIVRPPNIDPDRFFNLRGEKERSEMDTFFALLANFPGEGLIEIQFRSSASRKERIKHIRNMIRHVKFRKFDVERISFRLSEGEESVTTFWRIENEFKWLLQDDDKHKVIKAEEFEAKYIDLFRKNPK